MAMNTVSGSARLTPLGIDVDALEADLRAAGCGEVRFDDTARSAYSTDASNYRQVPIGVVVLSRPEDAVAVTRICARYRAPLLSRGGGTSLAGECTNTAVVMDWSAHCDRLESLDVDERTCVVQPGLVLDVLNGRLSEHGLRFGPEPSTHPNCTIGGMIGNNSCGATAQAYGKVVDNLVAMEVLTYDGERFWVGATDDPRHPELSWDAVMQAGGRRARIYRELRELGERHADQIRQNYPDIPRRVSGYNLDELLPGGSFNVARALTGSEATCVTVLRAELKLVPLPGARTMVVLGYADVVESARSVPVIAAHHPHKLEGVDHRLVELEQSKSMRPGAIGELPEGRSWLMVSMVGDDQQAADDAAQELLEDLSEHGCPPHKIIEDPEQEEALWSVREAGLGATARPGGPAETSPDCWPGWEDAAVDPDRLADYLRDFASLLERYDYQDVSLYGHFGHGCVHCRIPFDLVTKPGVDTFRAFLDDAADLVVSYGGSLSGEHGDGQARGALLEKMFGPQIVAAFETFRSIWDPDAMMNPGKVVRPASPVQNLRLGPTWTPDDPQSTAFAYPRDDGSFQRAVLRCVGVGKCHSPEPDGKVMCPSYRATRAEEHSTRGRSRLLFEMLDGHADGVLKDAWRSEAVKDALDLCLSCKGCLSDCPMHVDMASYKAEFLHHHYAGRLRPLAHYSMGWLPVLSRVAALAPRAVNALSSAPGLSTLVKAAGGIAQERQVPQFAAMPFTTWMRRLEARGQLPRGDGHRGEVMLWPDTFTNFLSPQIAVAAFRVMEDAGFTVRIPEGQVCCGLTWISTGQLGVARKVLQRTLRTLSPALAAGMPVVGLEPSCTAVFRADATELLPHDRDAERLKDATLTLAELLLQRAADWSPPRRERSAIVQMHCHQHAVLGQESDVEMMKRAGVDAQVLDSGCCGLAGNFGFEKGHYEVSMACAEEGLLPAVRAADADTLVVADGFSCRTQVQQSDAGAGRSPVHLAQVLAEGLAPLSRRSEPH